MNAEKRLLLPSEMQEGWGLSAVDQATQGEPSSLSYGRGFAAQYQQQQLGSSVPWPDVCALIDMAEEALAAKSQKIEELASHESLVSADSGFLQEQVQNLLSDNASMKERISLLERENRFLLEERDLMQQQLQQLAERTPTRTARRGAGAQGTPFDAQGTPFDTPCTRDAEDFASGPLSAGVPFRGFATAGDDAVVGTPSPFGSAMSQHMADRASRAASATGSPAQRDVMSDPESDTPARRQAQLADLWWRCKASEGSSSPDDELIKSCGRRDETPFFTPVRSSASARKSEQRPDATAGGGATPATAAQKAAARLDFDRQGRLSLSGTPASSAAPSSGEVSPRSRDAAANMRQRSQTPDLEMAALNLRQRVPARSLSAGDLVT